MATYVIGDIHGRLALLERLLQNVPWDVARDKIVFLGDLIDRGVDASRSGRKSDCSGEG